METTLTNKAATPEDSSLSLSIQCNNRHICESKKKLRSADSILVDIGWQNAYVLRIASLTSLSWTFAAMSIMCSAFYIVAEKDNNAVNSSDILDLSKNVISTNSQCSTSRLKAVADHSISLFMFGSMIGAIILTYASDKIGRKPIIVIAMTGLAFTGFIPLIGDQVTLLPFARFLQGFHTPGLLLIGWVLTYECTPVSFRAYASLTFGIFWVIGYCIVALIAYYTPNWIFITIACTAPNGIVAILFAVALPESLHFLVIKRKSEKVRKWIDKAREHGTKRVTLNNEEIMYSSLVDFDNDMPEVETYEKPKRLVFDELKSHKIFFIYLLILIYLWTCDTFIYFGLSLYTTKLAGNVYWNYTFSGLIELPVYVLTPIFLERFGRKPIVVVTHFAAGTVLTAFIFITDTSGIAKSLWIIGKFSISCSFICIFVYSSEIFPTTIRSGCVGICIIIARIGGILSPYVGRLAEIVDFLPMLFFGILSIVAATITLLLPETLNEALPSSLSEIKARKSANYQRTSGDRIVTAKFVVHSK